MTSTLAITEGNIVVKDEEDYLLEYQEEYETYSLDFTFE